MLRIIIVDDESTALSLLSDCIKSLDSGFKVLGSFTSGEDALKFLETNECDVLITDIKMPGISGLELAKRVSELYHGIKTIIVSAYQEFEFAKKAIEYGVYLYLVKPVNFRELYDALIRIKANAEDSFFIDNKEITPDEHLTAFLLGNYPASESFRNEFLSEGNFEKLLSRSILLIDITLSEKDLTSVWNYGRDRIQYFLKNIILDSSKSDNVYFAYRKKERFIFLVAAPFNESTASIFETNLRMFFNKLVDKLSFRTFQSIYETAGYLASTSSNAFDDAEFSSPLSDEFADYALIIEKAKKYIEENYKLDIMRDDVAEHIFVSPSYFSRLFKQVTGTSFSDYLTAIRIKNAIYLLEKGEKPTKIYSKVGYNSNKYFIKNFQKQTLYTPSEYQQKILKTGDDYED